MSRLQQSLSTPCPQENVPSTTRKESEYRRFKVRQGVGIQLMVLDWHGFYFVSAPHC